MTSFIKKLVAKLPAVVAVVVALGVSAPGTSSASSGEDAGWVQIRNQDGIRVSRKQIPGSPLLALRGEGDVDKPLLLVGSVVVDVSRDPEWVDSVVEARVLRAIDPSDYVTYSHVGTPLTLADRDFVTQVALEVDPTAKELRIHMHSVSDPLAPKTRYVRGDVTESTLILTSVDGGRRTHVVAEIHADPRGGIAPWIVNWFQRDWGYNTLKRLRAQVVKPSIRVDRGLKTLLEERGYFGSGRDVRLEEASNQ